VIPFRTPSPRLQTKWMTRFGGAGEFAASLKGPPPVKTGVGKPSMLEATRPPRVRAAFLRCTMVSVGPTGRRHRYNPNQTISGSVTSKLAADAAPAFPDRSAEVYPMPFATI